jgi:hypothetical protein
MNLAQDTHINIFFFFFLSPFSGFCRRNILHRPQAGFVEAIPNKGSVPATVSPSTEKARAAYKERSGVSV